ncbi:MAG TPA: plastocyanin/azurin family copper-binding protein [Nitrososphaera sp.]|nr:plastocyanin/azurin family copper-binding protein [Nitrososphaera sp.]
MVNSTAAVLAGLAVGIGLIAAFSILDAGSSFQTQYEKKDVVSLVVIPTGASSQNSGKDFEPPLIAVVIGKNNTVTWVNKDIVAHSFKADSSTADPEFYHATNNATLIGPNQTFEFMFTKPGTFGYHGEPYPWLRGTVIVLPSS